MKRMDIVCPVEVYDFAELGTRDQELVELAKQATFRSYSPYSHFAVGAAILLGNEVIITGSNQENAAFPSGICAERSACFYAHAQYPDSDFRAIAIAARDDSGDFIEDPIPPCGACRQALLEYETLAGHHVPVFLVGKSKIYRLYSITSLLPLAFTKF